MRGSSIACAWIAASLLAIACDKKPVAVVDEPTWTSAPSAEDGADTCADVRGARACWGADGQVRRVTRPTPDATDAWRCAGRGSARTCRRRAGTTAPFSCKDDRCEQPRPRMPDDGEWECFARAGATVCRGGEPASGAIGGRRDEAWICGVARDGGGGARICVDLAPDMPDDASFETCAMQYSGAVGKRVCVRKPEQAIGGACEADAGCPRGAVCVRGVCLPSRAPRGECWLDTDCGAGEACVFATCGPQK